MEFIRTIRERRQTRKQEDLHKLAEETIEIKDFADSLYFAYDGVPYVPISKEWTSVEIIKELAILRKNFINAKMKENRIRVAAL
jgi:hypothetical protein